MEANHICASICDQLPTLSANHPWLVDGNFEEEAGKDNRDYIIYTTHNPLSKRRYRIPSVLGRRIRGCFHGWVVLSNHPHNDMWSLWNPVTSKIICLPRFRVPEEDSDYIESCCLSSPPDVRGSVSLLMLQTQEHAIVFCRLDRKRNKSLKWVKMSYAKQMRRLNEGFDGYLCHLTCCNGKVYALSIGKYDHFVIQLDIVVKGGETVVSLLRYMEVPSVFINGYRSVPCILKGCCTNLFYIKLGFIGMETLGGVHLFKLDVTNMKWEEMKDLKDAAFFWDSAHDYSVFYNPAVAALDSKLGGYIHILGKLGKVIHSYNINNKTIALSSMAPRLQGDHEEIKCGVDPQLEEDKEIMNAMVGRDEEITGSRLLSVPSDVLKKIMEFCVGVEYLNFRASCKQCLLAAPVIQWSKRGRLRTYSLNSPWLMVLHKDRGVITFTDPMFGDEYFIKTPPRLMGVLLVHCSMYGWTLIRKYTEQMGYLMFFNPFTGVIRDLPWVPYLDSFCFSAPPTSSECMVVGFSTFGQWQVYIHYVARGEPIWRRFELDFRGYDSHPFRFATTYGQNLYAMCNGERLEFIDINQQNYTWRQVLPEGPRSRCESCTQDYLVKCDQRLLLVVVAESGESVEVFKLNDDATEWERIESLGRYMIYIGRDACLCVEAKTREMENKIYFPRVCSADGKIVFYSLETRRYHTFNGKSMKQSFEDFMGTIHHCSPHLWIEPSWS